MSDFDTKRVKQALRQIRKVTSNAKQPLKQIGNQQIREMQTRIRLKKTTPDGMPWRPWAYSTFKQRIKDGSVGKGLLYKSGLLLNSFYKRVDTKTLLISNRTEYFSFIQMGTNKMPSRPIMGWGADQKNIAEDVMIKHLKKVIK